MGVVRCFFIYFSILLISFASAGHSYANDGRAFKKSIESYPKKDLKADNSLDDSVFRKKGDPVKGPKISVPEPDEDIIPSIFRSPWIQIALFNGNPHDPKGWGRHPYWHAAADTGSEEDIETALKLITFPVEQYYPEGVRVFLLVLPSGSSGALMGPNQYQPLHPNFREAIGDTLDELRGEYSDIHFILYAGHCTIPDPNNVACPYEEGQNPLHHAPQLSNIEHVHQLVSHYEQMQEDWKLSGVYLDNFGSARDYDNSLDFGFAPGEWLGLTKKAGGFQIVGVEPPPITRVLPIPPDDPHAHVINEERMALVDSSYATYGFYHRFLSDFADTYGPYDPHKTLHIIAPHAVWGAYVSDAGYEGVHRTNAELTREVVCDIGAFLSIVSAEIHMNNAHLAAKVQKHKDLINLNFELMKECHGYVPDYFQ